MKKDMEEEKNKKTSFSEKKQSDTIKKIDLITCFLKCYSKDDPIDEVKKIFNEKLSLYFKQEISSLEGSNDYNILVLYDNIMMVKADSDRIYNAINSFEDKEKPILLIILSSGGEPASAYLIGKLCQEFSNEKFVVVIPRFAKSAATLLSCAANEIHMGSLSELGPIDPQIERMPTLGLKNSIGHIAELVSDNPKSSEMFAKYLESTVKPIQIGYYERVAESAVQYAEKLLNKNIKQLSSTPKEIAERLVYGYKDHGFVIDKEEAIGIFGEKIIRSNTNEYKIGNLIYSILSMIENWAHKLDYNFYYIGTLDSNPEIWRKSKNS